MNARSTNDEAAAWAVRLDGAQLSAQEQQQLDAWLALSPRHPGALLRARAVWSSLGAADEEGAAEAPRSLTRQAPERPPGRRGGLIGNWRAAAALVAAVAAVLLGYRLLGLRGEGYETRVGEVQRIALEDGSAITLNSDSAARVRFGAHQRAVVLTRGEGLFEVAKDKTRPFVVSTGGVSVRAVGTAFAVRALPDAVTVTVTEGVVEVSGAEVPAQRVAINQRAEIRPRHPVIVRSQDPGEAGRQLSWRDGILSFSGESLAEAVREVNRYSHRQVEVADPALARRPVIGIFRAGDIDAFAQSTAVALGAKAEADGAVIRLVPASP
ncbi:MAG: FecR domain-containing protein [Proteobacteria bacterium]|nr:FecR domain-containing protein [Pseudomonadota bacterium]